MVLRSRKRKCRPSNILKVQFNVAKLPKIRKKLKKSCESDVVPMEIDSKETDSKETENPKAYTEARGLSVHLTSDLKLDLERLIEIVKKSHERGYDYKVVQIELKDNPRLTKPFELLSRGATVERNFTGLGSRPLQVLSLHGTPAENIRPIFDQGFLPSTVWSSQDGQTADGYANKSLALSQRVLSQRFDVIGCRVLLTCVKESYLWSDFVFAVPSNRIIPFCVITVERLLPRKK
jgi:hypothetical protein